MGSVAAGGQLAERSQSVSNSIECYGFPWQRRYAGRQNPPVGRRNLSLLGPVEFSAGRLSRMSKALPKGGSALS